MLKQRVRYWSCSKLANFIRGCEKPPYLSMDDWEKWRSEVKAKSPIRYFIAEKLLNKIQDFINLPKDIYNSIRYYIRNRFITKTHYLKTGLKPGVYHELDKRIMYGLFNELVDFVEIEQAYMNYIVNDKKYKFKNGRCIESGLDYLGWAVSLKYDEGWGLSKDDENYGKPASQAESAAKILELYTWWKDRRYRPKPMEVSGWLDYEEKYEKEDEDMLIELMKIRKHLWT